MAERVKDGGPVKSNEPPRTCSCHPTDIYFPCQREQAFTQCENKYLRSRVEQSDRVWKEVIQIIEKNHDLNANFSSLSDLVSAIFWMADNSKTGIPKKNGGFTLVDNTLLEIAAEFLRAKSETPGVYRRRYKGELCKADEIADAMLRAREKGNDQ